MLNQRNNYNYFMRGVFSFRSLVLYFIPLSRLEPHIPKEFRIPIFKLKNKQYAIIGIEHFEVKNLKSNFFLNINRNFHQTNYLAFVENTTSEQKGYYYFGGTNSAKVLNNIFNNWQAPWYRAIYKNNLIRANDFFKTLCLNASAQQLKLILELNDLNKPFEVDLPEIYQKTFLHLVESPDFYAFENLYSKKMKFYSIKKEKTAINKASIKKIESEVFQNLCLLTSKEIIKPHSAFIFAESSFQIAKIA